MDVFVECLKKERERAKTETWGFVTQAFLEDLSVALESKIKDVETEISSLQRKPNDSVEVTAYSEAFKDGEIATLVRQKDWFVDCLEATK